MKTFRTVDKFPDGRPSQAPSPGPASALPREQKTPALPGATQKLRTNDEAKMTNRNVGRLNLDGMRKQREMGKRLKHTMDLWNQNMAPMYQASIAAPKPILTFVKNR